MRLRLMRARFRVDAVPGYEDAVESELADHDEVVTVARERHGNHEFEVVVELKDEAALEAYLANELHHVSGARGYERVDGPTPDPTRDG